MALVLTLTAVFALPTVSANDDLPPPDESTTDEAVTDNGADDSTGESGNPLDPPDKPAGASDLGIYLINRPILLLNKYTFFQLEVTTLLGSSVDVVWSSGDVSIATVDKNGYVKGIDNGTTTIYAKSSDGTLLAQCRVTVITLLWQWAVDYILSGLRWLIEYILFDWQLGLSNLELKLDLDFLRPEL